MAFNAALMSKLGNLSPQSSILPNNSFWVYEGVQTLALQTADGYFNDWREQLQVADKILVFGSNGSEIITVAAVPATGNVTITRSERAINGVAAGYVVARGQHTTVDENDTVVTGLTTVVSAVASLDDDPVAGCQSVSATIGDQAGAPAAGSVQIKSWKATAAGDTAVIAGTTFGKKVNWIAVGTL